MSERAFRYVAINPQGGKQRGVTRAPSEQEAYRRLAASGLTPVSLSERRGRGGSRRSGGVSRENVAALTRELSILVAAKIPLARGLRSIAESEESPRLREVLLDLVSAIEAGESLTGALSRHPDVFDDVFIETMRAAEVTGNLAAVADFLAEMLERQIEISRQIRRAMAYPLVVIGFVILAVTVIVVFVVPRFGEVFQQNGVELPILTRMLKVVGDSVAAHWWAYAGGLLAAAGLLWRGWRTPGGRLWLERMLLRVPHIGELIVASTATRFNRVLAISLDSGMDLIESIEMAGRSSGRRDFAADTERMADRVRAGATLREVIGDTRYLPNFAQRMLSAGKDAKEVAGAARVIARHYDRLTDHLAKTISTFVEPMITVAMAGIVLLVALSVFLPMWQMLKVG